MPEPKLKPEVVEPEVNLSYGVDPSVSVALVNVVEQVCVLTGADGAAVALRDSLGVRCFASKGEAPAVGARLDPNSAFTRECLEHGTVMLCNDAEADSRIRPEVARLLHLRSVLAVAIQAQGSILGVLEVFSSQPSVFDSTHVAALQQIANVLAPLAALVSEQVEPPVADRFSAVAAESVPRAPERSEGPPSAIPVEAPKRLVDSPSPTVRPESVSPAAWPEILQAVKKRVPHSFAKKFSVVRAFLAGIVTLIVFVLLFLFGGSLLRAIRTSSTTAATAVRLASGGPRPDEGTIDPTGASARDKIEATRIDSAFRPLVERDSSKELLHASPAATKPAESIAAASVPTEPPIDAPAVEPSPVAAASAPPPVVLDSHPVRTTQAETGAAPSLDAAMVAPTAESALAGMTPAVNASVRPAPRVNADLPVPVGGQIKQPLLVSQVSPEYPALARQTGIQGVVVVEIVIEKSGSVGDVKVVSGPPVLRQAAVDAVRRWKYQITLLDGEPVAVRMSVTIRFTYS